MPTQDITITVSGPAVLRVRETDTGIEVEQRTESGENEILEVVAGQGATGPQGPMGVPGTPGAAGADGRHGSYERTIFRAANQRPAQPTAPTAVLAGETPSLPANTTASPPNTTTAIWASIQRRGPGNATAVTYTTWRRWDGVDGTNGRDGTNGTDGADGATFTMVANQAAAEAMPDDDNIFYWWPA